MDEIIYLTETDWRATFGDKEIEEMSDKVEITLLKIKIKDKVSIELTLEEAKDLHRQLGLLFNQRSFPYHPLYPFYTPKIYGSAEAMNPNKDTFTSTSIENTWQKAQDWLEKQQIKEIKI